jgi:hypothetical protein
MSNFIGGVGPLFGPDFVVVTVDDETGVQFDLEVYPDANNALLKDAGLPTQYYFQPQRVYLAKKQDSPQDFDFGMTIFKGLATAETTLGLQPGMTVDGAAAIGGGFCSFSTTFGIPDSVIAAAIEKLKAADHPAPSPRLADLFNYGSGDVEPRLGIVPITDDAVTIAVPDLVKAADGTKVPMFISAQTTGKGSIEAHGFNSFLVTCNQFAGGAIAGSLEAGMSPFVVTNTLTEAFYVNGVTAVVKVDVDKVYDSFSLGLSTGGFLGINTFAANMAYSNCQTSGAITTEITENGNVLDPKVKDWIDQKVDEMRKTALDLVKEEIFDWDPSKADTQAQQTDRGWFSSVFGGSSVSLKSTYEKKGVHLDQTLVLNETITVTQAVSGDLNDLLPAVKANPEKYLAIVDINSDFQIIEVSGVSAINFGETLSDGTVIKDPIVSAQLSIGYPDLDAPLDASGKPNLRILGDGFHYTLAARDPQGQVSPAIWHKDNPGDLIKFEILRLDKDIAGWPTDQVMIQQRLVYDGDDPRVNISPAAAAPGGGGLVVELTQQTLDHTPQLTAAMVGYVYVKFKLDTDLPKSNVSVTITPTIGGDTYPPIVITRANQSNALWEVFSDKYFATTEFSYTVAVAVSGEFPDPSVDYAASAPVTVSIPAGRIKYLNPLIVPMPAPPADKLATVRSLITNAPS